MIKATCKFCQWEQKTNSVYKSYSLARDHLYDNHPDEFNRMKQLEKAIRDEHSTLYDTFGLAVRPLKMNL